MGDLPLQAGYWIAALSPLVLVLLLLVGLRWKAAEAGGASFFLALGLAIWLFRAGLEPVAVATGKGIWDAAFVLYVVWPALLLYQFTKHSGAFESFRKGAEKYTRSDLLLVLAFGWVFASFLQGIAGFGAPIAIVAPLLVGIGVRPVMAVVIPLIGHAWANLFGTLAVAWLALARVTEMPSEPETALQAALLLAIPNLLGGITIAWLYGRGKAVVRALPAIGVISLIHAGGQIGLAPFNPVLSNFVPVTVALGAMLGLARLPMYRKDDPIESKIMSDTGRSAPEEAPDMPVYKAIAPYILLVVLTVTLLAIPALNDPLSSVEIGLPFPETSTGFGVVTEGQDSYGGFAPLTHPGTFLLAAAVFAFIFYRKTGSLDSAEAKDALVGTVSDAVPASIAIAAFLSLSQVMEHAGMTPLLAEGVAAALPPMVYAAVANLIGLLGAFMTSSNTSSNILFGPFQAQTAEATGLAASPILASQGAGAATGNAVAPANVVLGTTTAGIRGQEGQVLRYTLVWALAVAALMGGATVLFLSITG